MTRCTSSTKSAYLRKLYKGFYSFIHDILLRDHENWMERTAITTNCRTKMLSDQKRIASGNLTGMVSTCTICSNGHNYRIISHQHHANYSILQQRDFRWLKVKQCRGNLLPNHLFLELGACLLNALTKVECSKYEVCKTVLVWKSLRYTYSTLLREFCYA